MVATSMVRAKQSYARGEKLLHAVIYSASVGFIAILELTGWMEPRIRVLHLVQALIYVAVMVLAARRSVVGYGAGIGIASFWNAANFFVTPFFRRGWEALVELVRTGSTKHPDMLVAPVAGLAHFVLIAACLAAYGLRTRKRSADTLALLSGGIGAVVTFYWILRAWGPQYLYIFSPILRSLGIHTGQ
jgi:hypothetical protein